MCKLTAEDLLILDGQVTANGLNFFGYNTTSTGILFCDMNCMNHFPEEFAQIEEEFINVEYEDVFDADGNLLWQG